MGRARHGESAARGEPSPPGRASGLGEAGGQRCPGLPTALLPSLPFSPGAACGLPVLGAPMEAGPGGSARPVLCPCRGTGGAAPPQALGTAARRLRQSRAHRAPQGPGETRERPGRGSPSPACHNRDSSPTACSRRDQSTGTLMGVHSPINPAYETPPLHVPQERPQHPAQPGRDPKPPHASHRIPNPLHA